MDLGLTGKVAVVTGASKEIGLAIARTLAEEGVTVVAGARSGSKELDELTRSHDVRSFEVDPTTPDGPAALVAAASDGLGHIDILVNNVGAVRPRLADLVTLVAADRLGNLTGSNIVIDGGLIQTL
jgi:NAD(P)-dependent dehydrogenase (short-subunit alcohol dehydrogenase family)